MLQGTATDYPLSINPAYQVYDGKMGEEPIHCEGCGDKCETVNNESIVETDDDCISESLESMYELGHKHGLSEGQLQGRSEAVATIMNLLKEDPNIDGLEILKAL